MGGWFNGYPPIQNTMLQKICSNTNIGGINYEIIKYLILSFILLFMQQCTKMV